MSLPFSLGPCTSVSAAVFCKTVIIDPPLPSPAHLVCVPTSLRAAAALSLLRCCSQPSRGGRGRTAAPQGEAAREQVAGGARGQTQRGGHRSWCHPETGGWLSVAEDLWKRLEDEQRWRRGNMYPYYSHPDFQTVPGQAPLLANTLPQGLLGVVVPLLTQGRGQEKGLRGLFPRGAHLVGGLDQLLGFCSACQIGFFHFEEKCSHYRRWRVDREIGVDMGRDGESHLAICCHLPPWAPGEALRPQAN